MNLIGPWPIRYHSQSTCCIPCEICYVEEKENVVADCEVLYDTDRNVRDRVGHHIFLVQLFSPLHGLQQ